MWTYEQATGKLTGYTNGLNYAPAVGYAGRDEGKNNPDMQNVKGIGPLPKGLYTILPPRPSPVVGPYALPLLPDPHNEMFNRSSFYIHGDSVEHPGEASHGCIVIDFSVRHLVWLSNDHVLEVV